MMHTAYVSGLIGGRNRMSERRGGATGWRGSQNLFFTILLFTSLIYLSGCGSGQTDTGQTGNSVPVSLSISLPQNSASAASDMTISSRFWVTLQSWLITPTNAWAQTATVITAIQVDVTGPDIHTPISVTETVPPGTLSESTFKVELAVPAGESRVFAVTAFAGNTTYTGKSSPTDLTAGNDALVAVTLSTAVPFVKSISPAPNATGVATTTTIVLTFSTTMNAENLSVDDFLIAGTNAPELSNVTYDTPHQTATLTFTSAFAPDTTYTISVAPGTITDLQGNNLSLAGPPGITFPTRFTTQACPACNLSNLSAVDSSTVTNCPTAGTCPAPLMPAFSSSTTSYGIALITALQSTVGITATLATAGSTLTINGQPATSGVVFQVLLAAGSTTIIPILVTAGGTSQTYTVTLTKPDPSDAHLLSTNPPGYLNNVGLAGLQLTSRNATKNLCFDFGSPSFTTYSYIPKWDPINAFDYTSDIGDFATLTMCFVIQKKSVEQTVLLNGSAQTTNVPNSCCPLNLFPWDSALYGTNTIKVIAPDGETNLTYSVRVRQ